MKKKALCAVLAGLMAMGCVSPVLAETAENEEVTITMMIGNDQDTTGLDAVFALAEEKLGIHVEVENRVDETVLKTRLASGDATDIVVYNSGALLAAQNPAD